MFQFCVPRTPLNYQQGMALAILAWATLQTGLVDSGFDWIGDAVSTCGSPEPSSMLGSCTAGCNLSYSSGAREIWRYQICDTVQQQWWRRWWPSKVERELRSRVWQSSGSRPTFRRFKCSPGWETTQQAMPLENQSVKWYQIRIQVTQQTLDRCPHVSRKNQARIGLIIALVRGRRAPLPRTTPWRSQRQTWLQTKTTPPHHLLTLYIQDYTQGYTSIPEEGVTDNIDSICTYCVNP